MFWKGLILLGLFIFAGAQHEGCNIASSSNDLCFALLKQFPERQNVFFSPASIYIALGILYAGANGTTAEAMQRVLNYNDTVHQSFGSLISLLTNESSEYQLNIANAMLYQQNYSVLPEFKLILQNYYNALLKELDFEGNSTGAIEEINNWANENTNGKIPKIVEDLPANTVMVLLNAIYYKGTWKKMFDPEHTHNGTFYNNGVDPVSIPMMNIEDEFPLAYYPDKKVQAIELPYKGEHISMLILLPSGYDNLNQLEKELDSNSLNEIISSLNLVRVTVTIPKFKLEDSRKLKSNLTALGLGEMFTSQADLSGISGAKNLMVSEIHHKAAIEVNEEGSEAAAVTSVVIVTYSQGPEFNVNRPFLFFIIDKRTNMTLFAGRVNNL